MMSSPNFIAALPIIGANKDANKTPDTMVTKGVIIISIFVSLETSFPNSAATIETKNTAKGPPAPPSILVAYPTVINENNTKGGDCNAYPIAVAIAGPLIALANPPIVKSLIIGWENNFIPN